jgi:hypothetical protein
MDSQRVANVALLVACAFVGSAVDPFNATGELMNWD